MGLAVGTAKYLLFFFNFIFFVTGITIIALAAVVKSDQKIFSDKFDASLHSVAVFLIIVGAFVTIISFFGCCGAIRNSHCMLMTFSVILGLIFIFEFAAGIAAYVKKDDLKDALHKTLDGFINEYDNNTKSRDNMDDIQIELHCCGDNGPEDWKKRPIPTSCCGIRNDTTVKCDNTHKDFYKEGCYDAAVHIITDNSAAIGAGALVIAFIQIMGIVLACCLASGVKNHV